jgi:spore coat protein CotH
MKNILRITLILLIFYSCNNDKDPIIDPNPIDTVAIDTTHYYGVNYVYDIKDFPVINLTISTKQWNQLLSNYDKNPNNEEYIAGDFTFSKGDILAKFDSIGIRIRGNTSRRRPEGVTGEIHNTTNPNWHHASFSVKLNKFVKGQKMQGVEKINLKWFKDDGMYAREVYCYDLFERFGVWTAPQSSYCRLNIKIREDEKQVYYGVYQMVEPVDEEYLINRTTKFADTKGNLWKASWGADLVNTDRSRMGLENVTLTSTYTPVYDLKTNDKNLEAAKDQLVEFMTSFKNKNDAEFQQWLVTRMDVELFLKTYAVNVICGMWDDYWRNSNNFYFYFDSAGKFYFIPYDYDNTLGTSLLVDDSGRQDLLNWGKSSNNLVKKIISIPEYLILYKSYLKELTDSKNNLFHVDASKKRILNWHKMIQNYISNDTGEDMSLIDVPASWGNCGFYRLLDSNNNYFVIRAASIPN